LKKRGGRKIWVNETPCETLAEAAGITGIPISSLCRLLRFGEVFRDGKRIAETPPKRAVKREPEPVVNGGALLRYPPGELLCRGLPPAWR
jgi:hypothetical protein